MVHRPKKLPPASSLAEDLIPMGIGFVLAVILVAIVFYIAGVTGVTR